MSLVRRGVPIHWGGGAERKGREPFKIRTPGAKDGQERPPLLPPPFKMPPFSLSNPHEGTHLKDVANFALAFKKEREGKGEVGGDPRGLRAAAICIFFRILK